MDKTIRERIEKEAETFFEFPTDDRTHVTTVSCKLFAEHVLAKLAQSQLETDRQMRKVVDECDHFYVSGVRAGWMGTLCLYCNAPHPAPANMPGVTELAKALEPFAGCASELDGSPEDGIEPTDDAGALIAPYACPPAPSVVPDGWKMVPVEPTDHMSDVGMVSAGIDITENDARHVYSAMLDASPQPAPTAVPEGWHISRTEGGNIIVQKSHFAGFVASEQSGGIAESTLYYLADDLLTASPAPDHPADVRKMVAPDVSELENAAQKLWRESYNCESDFIQAVVDALSKQEEAER